ncbi:MAG TPA: MarR family transcriptional regulator [Candidatus Baltobacteraceae bacterium]|jgi:DNA-binding MarR family transcriptional regulator
MDMFDPESVPQLPCVGSSLRRAARAATRLYERELRGSGLRSTQFTLLQALEFAGEITQGQLGSVLSIDSTTLTRSLQALVNEGWVKETRGDDRRERYLALTPSGRRKLEDTSPAWRRAQTRLKKALGRSWDELDADLRRITALER